MSGVHTHEERADWEPQLAAAVRSMREGGATYPGPEKHSSSKFEVWFVLDMYGLVLS